MIHTQMSAWGHSMVSDNGCNSLSNSNMMVCSSFSVCSQGHWGPVYKGNCFSRWYNGDQPHIALSSMALTCLSNLCNSCWTWEHLCETYSSFNTQFKYKHGFIYSTSNQSMETVSLGIWDLFQGLKTNFILFPNAQYSALTRKFCRMVSSCTKNHQILFGTMYDISAPD